MLFDKLWLAERRERIKAKAIREHFNPLLEAAKKDKEPDKYQEILNEFFFALGLNDGADVLRTELLVRRAARLGLPVPPKPLINTAEAEDNEHWYLNATTGNQYLTEKGQLELTREIRKEELERSQHRMRWVGYVAPIIIGVIGGLTGLISVNNSRKSLDIATKALLIQQTPEVVATFDPPINSDKILIQNRSAQDVVDVAVGCAAYLHARRGQPPIMTTGCAYGQFGEGAWWKIPKLSPEKPESKNFSDLIENITYNADQTIRMVEANDKRMGSKYPTPFQWYISLVFTVQYKRPVDLKSFNFYVSAYLLKDSQKGNYFITRSAILPEPDLPPPFPY